MVKSTVSERCTTFLFLFLELLRFIHVASLHNVARLFPFWQFLVSTYRCVRKTSAFTHAHTNRDWPLAHYPFHTFDPWCISQLSSDGIFFVTKHERRNKGGRRTVAVSSSSWYYITVESTQTDAQRTLKNVWTFDSFSVCMFSFVIFTLLIIINRYISLSLVLAPCVCAHIIFPHSVFKIWYFSVLPFWFKDF